MLLIYLMEACELFLTILDDLVEMVGVGTNVSSLFLGALYSEYNVFLSGKGVENQASFSVYVSFHSITMGCSPYCR